MTKRLKTKEQDLVVSELTVKEVYNSVVSELTVKLKQDSVL